MATIPRLPASAQPLDVTFTINVNLRPYLTAWFNATKRDGETVEEFVLRKLKNSAANWYISKEVPSIVQQLEQDRNAEIEEVGNDSSAFKSELD